MDLKFKPIRKPDFQDRPLFFEHVFRRDGWSLVAAGGAARCGCYRWQSRPDYTQGRILHKDRPSRQNTPAGSDITSMHSTPAEIDRMPSRQNAPANIRMPPGRKAPVIGTDAAGRQADRNNHIGRRQTATRLQIRNARQNNHI